MMPLEGSYSAILDLGLALIGTNLAKHAWKTENGNQTQASSCMCNELRLRLLYNTVVCQYSKYNIAITVVIGADPRGMKWVATTLHLILNL